jgi:cellulose biosynthesis protein BcsQ
MELIAFASGKGGTGKTLMASCLGYALKRSGHRVLMVDADPATDGLSLFLLGKNGMRQVRDFEDANTFTGILRHFQQTGQIQCEPRGIHRSGSDQQGDHGISYDALISSRGIYGDETWTAGLVVPDLDQSTFRSAVQKLFEFIKSGGQYDYVIVDTRGGFAFESTDVCALADSFIVITEPDVTSFYQDRNLVRRISDAAKQTNSRPLLRSIIVNKASEGDSRGDNIELDKLEVSFRLELEKEFPLKFLDTHPVPVDIEALRAYKTQRIPYLAAPSSLFAFATLSAYRDILQIVTARWTDDQVQRWNTLVETVSQAIAARNEKIKAESEARAEQSRRLAALQAENKELQERAEALKKEMERIENRYERELQRSTLFMQPPKPQAAQESIPVYSGKESSPSRATSFWSHWRTWVGIGLVLVCLAAGWVIYLRNDHETLLRNAYDESLPVASRVSYVRRLSQAGFKNFDGIKLAGANFSGVPLDHISFRSATLPSASFRGMSLPACDLSGADLSGADLSRANLNGCRLRNANLTGADLDGADLQNTDLSNVKGLRENTNENKENAPVAVEPSTPTNSQTTRPYPMTTRPPGKKK